MSAKLKIADTEDAERVAKMVAACHEETGNATTPEACAEAIAPLLGGSPHGVIYLIGPPSSPVGYLALSFGYSLTLGGLEGFIDEVYVRQSVRRRGMASEAVSALASALPAHGVLALHMRIEGEPGRFHARLRFTAAGRSRLLTRSL